MKRILSVLVILVLAFGVFSANALAAEKPIFTLTTKDKFNSGEVTAVVNVKNLTANALTIEVSFDNKVVELTGATDMQKLGDIKDFNKIYDANKSGVSRYSKVLMSNTSFKDGSLMFLVFKVKNYSAYNESTIRISGVTMKVGEDEITDYIIVNNNMIKHEHDDISDVWATTEKATCEKEGTRIRKCNVCGEIAVMETIPALEHKWNSGVNTRAATCTKDGVKTFTCLNDKTHTKTEVVEALGHKFGEWKPGANGQEISVCLNDSSHMQIRNKGSDTPIIIDKDDEKEEVLSSDETLSSEEGSATDTVGPSETSSGSVSSETYDNITPDMLSDEGIPTILIIVLVGAAVLLPILFIYMKKR